MPRKTKRPVSYAQQPERIGVPTTGNPLDGLVLEDPVAAVSDRRVETTDDRRSETAATENAAAVASSCAIPRSAIRNPHSLTPVFRNDARGIFLYHGNCLAILDAIAAKHPEGCFDTIFADPPYFLSNGGITCHAGRMVKVDKGDWDKSRGAEENHIFNTVWLRRCQRGY